LISGWSHDWALLGSFDVFLFCHLCKFYCHLMCVLVSIPLTTITNPIVKLKESKLSWGKEWPRRWTWIRIPVMIFNLLLLVFHAHLKMSFEWTLSIFSLEYKQTVIDFQWSVISSQQWVNARSDAWWVVICNAWLELAIWGPKAPRKLQDFWIFFFVEKWKSFSNYFFPNCDYVLLHLKRYVLPWLLFLRDSSSPNFFDKNFTFLFLSNLGNWLNCSLMRYSKA
jgi:hypothetical protein